MPARIDVWNNPQHIDFFAVFRNATRLESAIDPRFQNRLEPQAEISACLDPTVECMARVSFRIRSGTAPIVGRRWITAM
ncbi:hypothetical protein [Paraburkholderia guartelaensis]|uniref:Uncharacterized protein n=1 Tax=Paraburkholderia guartelaensis TaxID=2546446 RepID=A0ABU9S455_9BURK